MAYRLKVDESLAVGVRRIALEQIDKALDELGDDEVDRRERVHQLRKRCKKLRGLLRLVRPALGDVYQQENAAFRDIARQYSHLRDQDVLIDTLDKLRRDSGDELDRQQLSAVRRRLKSEAQRLAKEQVQMDDAVAQTRDRLQAARGRVQDWPVPEDDAALAAIRKGLKKVTKRGAKALQAAQTSPTPRRMHELRKRVKYTMYHMRLLRNAWPAVVKAHLDHVDDLADVLGDAHDLAVFEKQVEGFAHSLLDEQMAKRLMEVAAERRHRLDANALSAAELLLAEKPKCFAARMAGYLRTSRQDAAATRA